MDAKFFQAVAHGDIEYLNDLELGRLQEVTCEGDGVLHIAARFDQYSLVEKLYRAEKLNELDLMRPNNRGDTALHCAATRGNMHMVKLVLLEMAVRKNQLVELLRATNGNQETCLHVAVRNGRTKAVRLLVEADDMLPDAATSQTPLVDALDIENVSPLYLATTLDRVEIVRVLTEPTRRRPASYVGPRAKTALHAAAAVQNHELMELLLDWRWRRGANQPDELIGAELIRKADESGSTALHYLASTMGTHSKRMIRLLLERDRERGSNAPYSVDSKGSMPIHIAAAHGRLDIVKVLLEECPHLIWSCNSSGQTILHIAVQQKKEDIVAYICLGLTTLAIASAIPKYLFRTFMKFPSIARGNPKYLFRTFMKFVSIASAIPKYLFRTFMKFVSIARGNPNPRFRQIPSPFVPAAGFRTILNARDKDGNTALHLAVLAGYEAGFLSLLRRPQVNLNIANREGHTPLDLAYINSESKAKLMKGGHARILGSLGKAGACPGVQPLDDLIQKVEVEDDVMEKNWEKIGKAAGVLAVCAVLILNITFAMPFSVANYYYQHWSTNGTDSTTLRLFIRFNIAAFLSSAMTIFSCTYAGFAAVRDKNRLWHLYLGATFLGVASLAIVVAFILGLKLAFQTDTAALVLCVLHLLTGIAVHTKIVVPFWSIILHSIALRSRGTLRHHSFFYGSVDQNYPAILSVIFTSLLHIISCSFLIGTTVISGPKTDDTRIAPSPGPSIGHNNLQH